MWPSREWEGEGGGALSVCCENKCKQRTYSLGSKAVYSCVHASVRVCVRACVCTRSPERINSQTMSVVAESWGTSCQFRCCQPDLKTSSGEFVLSVTQSFPLPHRHTTPVLSCCIPILIEFLHLLFTSLFFSVLVIQIWKSVCFLVTCLWTKT